MFNESKIIFFSIPRKTVYKGLQWNFPSFVSRMITKDDNAVFQWKRNPEKDLIYLDRFERIQWKSSPLYVSSFFRHNKKFFFTRSSSLEYHKKAWKIERRRKRKEKLFIFFYDYLSDKYDGGNWQELRLKALLTMERHLMTQLSIVVHKSVTSSRSSHSGSQCESL